MSCVSRAVLKHGDDGLVLGYNCIAHDGDIFRGNSIAPNGSVHAQ